MDRASIGFLLSLSAGFLLAKMLPARLFIAAAARCGRLLGSMAPGRFIVARNLDLIAAAASFPPGRGVPGSAAPRVGPRQVYESYGRYWGEFLALAAHPAFFQRLRIRVEGEEHLNEAAARGPVCVLTGHMGNWDLGAWWAATRLPGLVVMAEPLRPPALFRLCSRLRRGGGITVYPAEGTGLRLYRHIRRGGHVALVADRVTGSGSRTAMILRGRRAFPAAGIDLASRAGASLIPAFLSREGDDFAIRVYPPLSAEGDPVQAFARILEGEILERPGQWCVLYPLHES